MVNLATYNVNGLADSKKRTKVFNYLQSKIYDIVCIQETHSTKNMEKIWRSQWGGQIIFSHGESNARGCAILFKKRLKIKINYVISACDGRYIIVDLHVKDYNFLLCCIYAPNTDDIEFFQSFCADVEKVQSIRHTPDMVLMGDFNTSFGTSDKKGLKGNLPGHPKVVEYLNEYFNENNLLDIWRVRHPNQRRFTFFRKKPHVLMERLDYIFVSGSLSNRILDSGIEPSYLSDHAIPHVTFSDAEIDQKGPGYWKLNIKHLEDEDFQQIVVDTIDYCCNLYDDIKLRWEMMKMLIRGEAIKFGTRKKKSQENKILVLENVLHRLVLDRESIDDLRLFDDHDKQVLLVQKDLEELRQKKAFNSALVNQRNWHAFGEKMSKYFFRLGRSDYKVPLIRVQIRDNIIDDQTVILDELKNYYEQLFTGLEGTLDMSFLDDVELPQISEEDKLMLDAPISLEEISIAIKQLKKEKCPSLDGFPIDFYQKFEKELKHQLHALFIKIVDDKEFHKTARQGILSLLEKNGKDQLLIKNSPIRG